MATQLVIQTHGVQLRLDEDVLVIRQAESTERVPAAKVSSILISSACSISSAVITYAAENDIDLVFTGRGGKPVARMWNTRYGSIASIRKNQLAFSTSPEAARWVRELYLEKIRHQQAVLQLMYHPGRVLDRMLDETVAYLEKYASRLQQSLESGCAEDEATLRGWEGVCGRRYFSTLSACLPPLYRFEKRSQHPARDLFNALLNYAYGILYGKIETALVKAGLDPAVGIFHRDEYNRPVLVYDVIERFRFWADIVVLQLCMQQVVYPDYAEEKDGGVWLGPEGRRILISTMNDYLAEVIDWEGQERSRSTHIDRYAQALAQRMKRLGVDDARK